MQNAVLFSLTRVSWVNRMGPGLLGRDSLVVEQRSHFCRSTHPVSERFLTPGWFPNRGPGFAPSWAFSLIDLNPNSTSPQVPMGPLSQGGVRSIGGDCSAEAVRHPLSHIPARPAASHAAAGSCNANARARARSRFHHKFSCFTHINSHTHTQKGEGAAYLLSQMTAFRSRWLVGSSSISRVGSMNRALWTQQARISAQVTSADHTLGRVVPLPGQGDPHSPASREPLGGSVLHLRGEGQTS